MRSKIFALVAMLTPVNALASVDLAEVPVSIRQTYRDHKFTEIKCDEPLDSGRQNCQLRIGASGRIVSTYSFSLDDYGYSSFLMMTSGHSYWPNGGEFPPSVRFDVSCNDQDLELIAGADENNTHCSIYFDAHDGRLVAKEVGVIAIINGKPFQADRDAGSPAKP